MTDTQSLRGGKRWRLAVWGLRVIGAGLAVVAVGLLGLLISTGLGQGVLAIGMAIYLVGVVISVVGIVQIYREASPPRPNFIELRWSLLYAAAHVRSASADERVASPGPLDEHYPQLSREEDLRRSPHWRPAVWGLRVTGLGTAVVVAGLITLLVSTSSGRAILVVGVGIYLVGVVVNLAEARRACGDIQPPRPTYARVRQTLMHDTRCAAGHGSHTVPPSADRSALVEVGEDGPVRGEALQRALRGNQEPSRPLARSLVRVGV